MAHPANLGELIHQLKSDAPIARLPLPQNGAAQEHLFRTSGTIVEIDDEMYFRCIGGGYTVVFISSFPPLHACAESYPILTLFWRDGDRYYLRVLNWEENKLFLRYASIFPWW
jgi:hypothetical protein